jgi:hypothetical protein
MSATRQGKTPTTTTHQSRPGIVRRHPASASRSASIAPPGGRRRGAPAQTTARHCQAPPFSACPTAEICVCPPQAVGWAHSRVHVGCAAGKRGFSGVWLASLGRVCAACVLTPKPLIPAVRNNMRGGSNVTRNQVGRVCNGRPDPGCALRFWEAAVGDGHWARSARRRVTPRERYHQIQKHGSGRRRAQRRRDRRGVGRGLGACCAPDLAWRDRLLVDGRANLFGDHSLDQ